MGNVKILKNENVERLFIAQIEKRRFLTLPIKTNTCRILYLQNISAKTNREQQPLKSKTVI